jgi:hypothetical protein
MTESLTGRTRFRVNWRGRVILRVEVERRYVCPYTFTESPSSHTAWRDANERDLRAFGLQEVVSHHSAASAN